MHQSGEVKYRRNTDMPADTCVVRVEKNYPVDWVGPEIQECIWALTSLPSTKIRVLYRNSHQYTVAGIYFQIR